MENLRVKDAKIDLEIYTASKRPLILIRDIIKKKRETEVNPESSEIILKWIQPNTAMIK